VTDDDNTSASLAKPRNGGERRTDAPVVGDAIAVKGNIEVATDEDLLATKIAERVECAKGHEVRGLLSDSENN
jgi:hypothetical protein